MAEGRSVERIKRVWTSVQNTKPPLKRATDIQIALINLNGNRIIPPTSFSTTSSVNPTIRNGNNNNQINGKRISITSASGQHMAKRIHHKMTVSKVLIHGVSEPGYKRLTNLKFVLFCPDMSLYRNRYSDVYT